VHQQVKFIVVICQPADRQIDRLASLNVYKRCPAELSVKTGMAAY